MKKNSDLPIKSSLNQKTSNIVGQMSYKGSDLLQLDYDFFADNNLGKFNYHKLKSTFKVNNFVTLLNLLKKIIILAKNTLYPMKHRTIWMKIKVYYFELEKIKKQI